MDQKNKQQTTTDKISNAIPKHYTTPREKQIDTQPGTNEVNEQWRCTKKKICSLWIFISDQKNKQQTNTDTDSNATGTRYATPRANTSSTHNQEQTKFMISGVAQQRRRCVRYGFCLEGLEEQTTNKQDDI